MGLKISDHKSFGGLLKEEKDVPHLAADCKGQWRRRARSGGPTSSAPFNKKRHDLLICPTNNWLPFFYLHEKEKCRRYLLVSKRRRRRKYLLRDTRGDSTYTTTVNRVRCRNKWLKKRDELLLMASKHSAMAVWRAASLVRETFH